MKERQPWHYFVISDKPITHYYYGGYEPPEDYYPYAELKAKNKREALMEAVKLPEFKEWVAEQRGDNKPPWNGLKAELMQCKHGTCWGCDEECEKCNKEFDDENPIVSS